MKEFDDDRPSKTQLKREADELQALGNALVKLPVSVLEDFSLPDNLLNAIKVAQSIKKNRGLKRQMQYIGKLMRQQDIEKIQKAYNVYFSQKNRKKDEFHVYEDWRDKFLNNDRTVFNDFLEQYPEVDRQHLRQLQRNALAEKRQEKPPKYARLLFKYIKESIDLHNQDESTSNNSQPKL